jgi:hypothetical protein
MGILCIGKGVRMVINIMRIKIIAAALCLTGCSYAMDYLDRSINKQSSFSINASYTPGSPGNLKVSWESQAIDDDEFAGYEVYMILKPWDEYGTYHVIAARYPLVSGPDFFQLESSLLANRSTHKVNISVSPSDLGGAGEYYVRVGVIAMDENGKDSNGNTVYYDKTSPTDYEDHSSIDSISGYQAVDIY